MLKRFWTLFLVLFLALSCGMDEEEGVNDAIDRALDYLSKGQCAGALEVLEEVGMQKYNASYLSALASSHACNAGFSEPSFFNDDLPQIAADSLLGSLTTMPSAEMTSAADRSFVNLIYAIDTLVYAGGVAVPTSAQRAPYFSDADLGNINIQALYMVMVGVGKYFDYYGNTNSSGEQGAGSETNKCLYDYTYVNVPPLPLGACVTAALGEEGSPGLPKGTAIAGQRMCQGVVLFNLLLDLLTNSVVSATSEFEELGSIVTQAAVVLTPACAAGGMGNLCSQTSVSLCTESYVTASGPKDELQKYFQAIFETLLVDA